LNNPVEIYVTKDKKDNLLKRLSSIEIKEIKDAFVGLEEKYSSALNNNSVTETNNILIKLFGERFPFRPNDILISSDIIRNTPAKPKKVTIPRSTTSG
jgi:hypothetical protein